MVAQLGVDIPAKEICCAPLETHVDAALRLDLYYKCQLIIDCECERQIAEAVLARTDLLELEFSPVVQAQCELCHDTDRLEVDALILVKLDYFALFFPQYFFDNLAPQIVVH